MRIADPKITSTVALVATSVWLGGILALGAIVAPIVFAIVPRPEAAEAMIDVFQRFDVVAVGSIVVIVATEAWRAFGAPGAEIAQRARIGRLDVARMVTGVVGAVFVLAEALWITPSIVSLHRSGAIRGVGSAGLELDRMHGLAESCGKVQVALALALIALHVATLGGRALGVTQAERAESKLAGGAPHGA